MLLILVVLLVCAFGGQSQGPSGASAEARIQENQDQAATALKDTETIDLGGGVSMEFVLIRPGLFMMGSESGHNDEKPIHQVAITRPFYLGRYEVTQEQWQRVMHNNPSGFKGTNLPVENVSWNDCQIFLAKLRSKTKRKFALPTEAQWEYACRAGTTNTYSCGEDEAGLADHAWYASNSDQKTHPVGRKQPNAWGLCDMHGNVFEWCADWYSKSYPPGDATDPVGAVSGDRRIIRGGAWLYIPDNLRSADRSFSPPDLRVNEYGLRCVMLVNDVSRSSDDARQRARPAGTKLTEGAKVPGQKPPDKAASGIAPSLASLKKDLVIDLGNGVTMEFALIPPGSFVMGSSKSKILDEQPAHQVTVTQPFYLGKYEVTQKQWLALMEHNPSVFKEGPKIPDGMNHPVDNVSWFLCQSFLAKLQDKAKDFAFRLPTEAEWEYACRAGSANEHSFGDGDTALGDYAWYGNNSDGQTHAAGGRKANGWGLYDMYGNVWEWCIDWYGPYASKAVADPLGSNPNPGSGRIVRGGAWNSLPGHVRSACRYDVGPDEMMGYYGFRCAATIRPAP
jgi:formylglycine-generating enzyme required for sulfatase activity